MFIMLDQFGKILIDFDNIPTRAFYKGNIDCSKGGQEAHATREHRIFETNATIARQREENTIAHWLVSHSRPGLPQEEGMFGKAYLAQVAPPWQLSLPLAVQTSLMKGGLPFSISSARFVQPSSISR